MLIHEFFYNNRRLYIEFSTKEDGEDFYRILELEYNDVIYYSTEIIDEADVRDFDENSVIDLLIEYLKENDLPEQLTL
jgi:hypothetical protein